VTGTTLKHATGGGQGGWDAVGDPEGIVTLLSIDGPLRSPAISKSTVTEAPYEGDGVEIWLERDEGRALLSNFVCFLITRNAGVAGRLINFQLGLW
jgi:hypothetical protein